MQADVDPRQLHTENGQEKERRQCRGITQPRREGGAEDGGKDRRRNPH